MNKPKKPQPKKPTKKEERLLRTVARRAAIQLFRNHFREQASLRKRYPRMEPWVLAFVDDHEQRWVGNRKHATDAINNILRRFARRLERMKL